MYPSNHSTENNDTNNDSVIKHPRVNLLSDEHWLYIRNQYYMSLRELQVAKLVCQGFNNEEIATSLKITQGTIKTHMRNIYRRIRVKNRIEMLLMFVDSVSKLSNMLEVKQQLTPDIKKPNIASIPDVS
jgi:DNA-binding NarL/FixJ family response regulator